jgi:hypothetical protein
MRSKGMPVKSRWLRRSGLAVLLLLSHDRAHAATIDLFEFAMNVDGAICTSPPCGGADFAGFDFDTGLGSIGVSIGGAGIHGVGLYVDHEIDETLNTFFNESGAVVGAGSAGLSWEIDDPFLGDIYFNFLAGALDGMNAAPSDADVSLALYWSFLLAVSQTATLTFAIAETAPAGGFFLSHTDPDSQATLYFSTSLRIADSPVGVPEPSIGGLLLAGVAGLAASRRLQRRRKELPVVNPATPARR